MTNIITYSRRFDSVGDTQITENIEIVQLTITASSGAPIPTGSSLQVLDGGAKIVLQSGDALKVVSNTATSCDAWVSVVDAIST